MLQSSLKKIQIEKGDLKLPPAGAKIQILYISKKTGQRKNAPISVGPTEGLYYAVFDEDDVDFQVSIDNTDSKYRSICVGLDVHQKNHRFVVDEGSHGILQTLDSNGRKFHFIRQSSEEGKTLVSTAADRHGLSYPDASIMISQIKFSVQFSLEKSGPSFYISVQDLEGRIFKIMVNARTTVAKLRRIIEDYTDIDPMDQTLMFCGGTLDDGTLGDHWIRSGCTINLVYRSVGGGGCVNCMEGKCLDSNCAMKLHKLAEENRAKDRLKKKIGERGAICFGDHSDQTFELASFVPDPTINVEPFLIEMRMASRYSLDF